MSNNLRIIVMGYIVRGPMGGMTWYSLQYVLGLAQLGYDVYFIEDSDDYDSCYNYAKDVMTSDPTYGLEYTESVFDRVGLPWRWVYYDSHTSQWLGPCADSIKEIISSSNILISLGYNKFRPWQIEIPVRILIDADPVFTQIRHITDPSEWDTASRFTSFFSFATNIGTQQCAVPEDGLPWKPSRELVVMDAWPVTPGHPKGMFTTVMQWDSYHTAEYNGRHYGMKSLSFEPYLDLPKKTGPIFELTLGISTRLREALSNRGWIIRSPFEITRDPWAYQYYIQQSKAEFSIAKHGYVVSQTGWFSERSAAYLASGRPVLTQDTGFSRWLPTGFGVLAFNSPEEALAGIEEINNHYDFHCKKAREIAEEYFDSRKILSNMLEQAMNN